MKSRRYTRVINGQVFDAVGSTYHAVNASNILFGIAFVVSFLLIARFVHYLRY